MWTPQAAPASSSALDGAPSPSWVPNPADVGAGLTISGYSITSTAGGAHRGVRGTVSQSSGVYLASYWPDTVGGHWAVGNDFVGIANASQSLATYLGSAGNNSVGWNTNGNVLYGNANIATVAPWRVGSRLDIAFVFASTKVYFRVNNGLWNDSSTATPGTDTGGIAVTGITGSVFPAVSINSTGLICHTQNALVYTASGATAPYG